MSTLKFKLYYQGAEPGFQLEKSRVCGVHRGFGF